MATIDRLRSHAISGLRLRPYAGVADLPEMVRITNAEAAALKEPAASVCVRISESQTRGAL